MKKYCLIAALLLLCFAAHAQFTPVHVHRTEIYDFLEEMATAKLIQVNTAVKPWSREFVYERLMELDGAREDLNKRQNAELDYFLRDYRKDAYTRKEELKREGRLESSLLGFGLKNGVNWNQDPDLRWDMIHYQDSLFSIRINPIIGYQYWFTADKEAIRHRWTMAEAEATVGKHWSFYASYRDNQVDQIFAEPEYFTREYGAPYKAYTQPEFHETRGGIFYSWDWGSIGFTKDHFEWGTNYRGSNIFASRYPSAAQISLKIKPAKWFEFNFVNAQLVSDMVDSTRSYYTTGGRYRTVVIQKYLSANMFTVTPTHWAQFSLGNSVIYSDTYHWAYLIPLYFYKSVDHTLNSVYKTGQSGQNAQIFMDGVLRPFKGLELNGTLFIDEFSFRRINDPDWHNFLSYKAGFMLSNLPFQNIQLFGEYTLTYPMTFQHNIESTTFESNSINMGHYMRDNSQEFWGRIRYKPTAHLRIDLEAWLAQHGDDYQYGLVDDPDRLPILENITWEQKAVQLSLSYKLFHNGRIFTELLWQNTTGDVEKYSPEFFHGKGVYVSVGAYFGL